MDTIVIILTALKIDKTVLIQFGFLIVFFNILAPLFFKRIQEVLEYRESKTTKLEGHAHVIYKQAEELAEQYKGKIEKAHADSQAISTKKKAEILDKNREQINTAEEQIGNEYDERKSKINKDISDKRIAVMAEAEKLSSSLVEKLTK